MEQINQVLNKFTFPNFRHAVFLLLFIILTGSCYTNELPVADRGIIDLRKYDITTKGPIALNGNWSFHWKKLINPEDYSESISEEADFIKVPAPWNGNQFENIEAGTNGYGTYSILIRLKTLPQEELGIKIAIPNTAWKLWMNGQLLRETGTVGVNRSETTARYYPDVIMFRPESRDIHLIIQVANFEREKGGLWTELKFGTYQDLLKARTGNIAVQLFTGGALFIMALYHLALYFLRPKEISNLYFSILSLVTSLRSLTTGEVYLMYIFPNFPFYLFFKVDVLTIYIALPSLILFTSSLYPLDSNKWINRIFLLLSSLLVSIVLVTPPHIFSQSINAFVIIAFMGLIYTFYIIGRASFQKRDGAMIFIGGFSLIFTTTINDMLHDNQVIDTGYFLAYGLFGFIFAQSFLLSRRFARAFMIVENLTDDLKKTNSALSRFVPREFLDLLLKDSILDVKLGDQVQREMTVAFADIRNFTSLVENLTPEESFDFVNQYLSRMNPAIKQHGGFIDKYIGDAIMALFPADPEDAIDASVEMFRALDVYNRQRRENNFQDIRIGIGIHTGNLMLGTVGGEERMDGTVISESVNLTSRLESLTKIYGAPLIISNTTLDKLKSTKKYRMRVLDMVKVRGSAKNTFLIEVIDSELNPEIIEKKMQTRKKYLDGLYEFLNGNFKNAAEIFKELIKVFPEDKASNLLFTRSEHFQQFGPPDGWKNANFPGPNEKKLTEQVFG